jgi:hypothetical protein
MARCSRCGAECSAHFDGPNAGPLPAGPCSRLARNTCTDRSAGAASSNQARSLPASAPPVRDTRRRGLLHRGARRQRRRRAAPGPRPPDSCDARSWIQAPAVSTLSADRARPRRTQQTRGHRDHGYGRTIRVAPLSQGGDTGSNPVGVLDLEPQVAARFVSLTWGFLVSGGHLVVSGSCHAVQPMMGRGPEIVPNCAQIVPSHQATSRRLPSRAGAGGQGRALARVFGA